MVMKECPTARRPCDVDSFLRPWLIVLLCNRNSDTYHSSPPHACWWCRRRCRIGRPFFSERTWRSNAFRSQPNTCSADSLLWFWCSYTFHLQKHEICIVWRHQRGSHQDKDQGCHWLTQLSNSLYVDDSTASNVGQQWSDHSVSSTLMQFNWISGL